MALPNSGSISLADIQNEFGGSNPIGLNEYYRNGSYVTPNNTNIPTSGLIDFNDFYGAETATFISGSGGSVTTSGDYKIHTFTSSGTMTFSQVGNAAGSNTVEYLVVGGGGGGASLGGGGAGGMLSGSNFSVAAQSYSITVGGGGRGGGGRNATGQPKHSGNYGGNGGNGQSNSISGSSVTYAGGGGGFGWSYGGAGGSGGGGRAYNWGVNGQPGTANRGGGGGARWGNGSPIKGTGGSGIVIIKYKYQ